MSEEYDGPWKEAIDDALAPCLALFYPDVHAGIDWTRDHEPLDQELQHPEPDPDSGVWRADKLFKAYRPITGDPRYLVLECQMNRDANFGRRLTDYWFRIRDKYGLPPGLLVIYGDDDPDWKPTMYQEGEAGTVMTLEFRPVKLVEWAGRQAELEAGDNIFGLFVAAHLQTLATRKDDAGRTAAKVRMLRNLAGRGMTPVETGRWVRLIDWLMKLPREWNLEVRKTLEEGKEKAMPYVTSFEEIGREIGMAKGLQEGKLLKARQYPLSFLRARFPTEADTLAESINAIEDEARLDALIPLAATASFEDFRGRVLTP